MATWKLSGLLENADNASVSLQNVVTATGNVMLNELCRWLDVNTNRHKGTNMQNIRQKNIDLNQHYI